LATKGEKTRQNIVAAAAGILNRRGYEGTSIGDLMEATGLKKGGIYRHFADKEQLVGEAFELAWSAAWDARMIDIEERPNGIDRLKQFIANFVENEAPIPGGCPLLNSAVDSDDGNTAPCMRVTKALRSWLGHIEKMVEYA
jgi:TetR/AcrR family transcriptional regulator, transcriptional repressor for nem operon